MPKLEICRCLFTEFLDIKQEYEIMSENDGLARRSFLNKPFGDKPSPVVI